MIRLDRGPEPAALAGVRAKELARLGAIAATREPTSDEIGDRYSVARVDLFKAQAYKCAFCEFKEQQAYNDVEHYRPKAGADRSPGSNAAHGYWWLAWTWENLLFACASCNRSHKRMLFPLRPGSVPLVAPEPPPGGESPLLIDPFSEDPIDFIQFRHARLDKLDRWQPFPRNGAEKGRWTIRVAKLDRPELLDHYDEHVKVWVHPRIEEIEKALNSGRTDFIRETWAKESKRLLYPGQAFAALSHDALDHYVPVAIRTKYDLPLKRPS
jgi:hypothetical protein